MTHWPGGGGEMAERIRAHDWAATPLGPIEGWPQSLKTVVELVLAHAFPMAVIWGPENINLYNDAFIPTLGGKHPATLGRPQHEVWPELRHVNGPLLQRVWTGETVSLKGIHLPSHRYGTLSDAWSDLTLSPIRDEASRIAGALATVFETTDRVLAERTRDRADAALRETEVWLAAQKGAFQAAMNDAPLEASLGILVRAGVDQAADGRRCAFYIADPEGRSLRHVAGMSRSYAEAVDGFAISPESLACGLAVASGRPVITRDVYEEPRWRGWTSLARDYGYRGCWSFPVETATGRLVGSLAMYFVEPRDAEPRDLEIAAAMTQAAAIVISRHQENQERARAEAALREREADLARVQRIGGVGGLDIDVAGGMTSRRSPEYLRLHGLPSGTCDETHADWRARVHPDDVEQAERRLLSALEGDARSYQSEYRIIRPSDGAVRWIAARTDIERDADGRALRMVGAHIDVTEQKRVQEALRESEGRLRQFGEASQDILWIREAETLQWTYLTPAFDVIYGLSREAALADDNYRGWQDLIVPEDRAHAVASIGRVRAGEHVTFEYRIRRPADGQVRWLRNTDFPMRDEAGRVAQIGGVGHDVTAAKAIETATALSEERLQLALDVGQLATWDWDMTTGQVVWNDEHCRMQGYEPGEVKPSLEAWRERVHPDDLEPTIAAIDEARDRRSEYRHEFRNRLPNGTVRWVYARGRFFYDEQGRPTRMIGVMEDVTDRQEAEKAVAASEDRLRTLMEGIPQLVWRSADDGLWTWSSPQWQTYTGQSQGESHGWGWLDVVHPDDREATLQAWDGARPHGRLDVEYRVRRAGDGAWRWHQTRSVPVRGAPAPNEPEGPILEWLGTTTDIQDLKALQEGQAVMVAELQHRTRNLIAVVQGIANETMGHTGPTEAFRDAFADRLSALSRVQGLLSRSEAEPITIGAVVRLELDALGIDARDGRASVSGPEVFLRPSTVQTLALALHELATNARKYGALSHERGHLAVAWRERDAGDGHRLALDWVETGLEQSPERPASVRVGGGYGRELIERALPHALGARTSYVLTDSGVRCTIDMPVRPGHGEDKPWRPSTGG